MLFGEAYEDTIKDQRGQEYTYRRPIVSRFLCMKRGIPTAREDFHPRKL